MNQDSKVYAETMKYDAKREKSRQEYIDNLIKENIF